MTRRRAIVTGIVVQALAVAGMAVIAILRPPASVLCLISLAVIYQAAANFVQPQWRGWMGSQVRRRGAFVAGRTRPTMITSFTVFAGGGALLGGYLASALPGMLTHLPEGWQPADAVVTIFGSSALL